MLLMFSKFKKLKLIPLVLISGFYFNFINLTLDMAIERLSLTTLKYLCDVYKPWESKGFSQFEIIMRVLVSYV